jgi:hypothetical protein
MRCLLADIVENLPAAPLPAAAAGCTARDSVGCICSTLRSTDTVLMAFPWFCSCMRSKSLQQRVVWYVYSGLRAGIQDTAEEEPSQYEGILP